jgi:hypothetical protein
VARHEQHTLLAARIERQRHRHVREDDRVVKGDEQVFLHDLVHAPELGWKTIVASGFEVPWHPTQTWLEGSADR